MLPIRVSTSAHSVRRRETVHAPRPKFQILNQQSQIGIVPQVGLKTDVNGPGEFGRDLLFHGIHVSRLFDKETVGKAAERFGSIMVVRGVAY